MFETALAQLGVTAAIAFGKPFSLWSLEKLVESLRDTQREFGVISAEAVELVSGPRLDEETQRAMQLRRFRAQAARAVRETPYYAHLFSTLGLDPAKLRYDDIARIPITPKEAVREAPDAFVRRGAKPYLRAMTNGTTGRPTRISFSRHELQVYAALQAIHALFSGDLQADDIVQISTSSRATLGNICLAEACAHVGALAIMTGLVDPAYTLAQLSEERSIPGKRARVSVLYTYPSYLGELVEYGLRLGYRPEDFSLRHIVVGGEVVTVGVQERARTLFGDVQFTQAYGMTEIWPFGGMSCNQGHLHFEASQGLLEVIKPGTFISAQPGEAGTIVATPFPPYRETTLLLRYNTEDVVRPLAGPLTCNLRHQRATTNLLGKLRLSVQHEDGWTYPRAVLEAVEAINDVPLPARCGFWAVPGGVAVEVVTHQSSRRTHHTIESSLAEHGVPVRELYLREDRSQLRQPLPLRGDLRETSRVIDWKRRGVAATETNRLGQRTQPVSH